MASTERLRDVDETQSPREGREALPPGGGPQHRPWAGWGGMERVMYLYMTSVTVSA